MLAGVSVEYYAHLERGNLSGASEAVLAAIADALQLDDAERAHLVDLARESNASPVRARRRAPVKLRPSMQWALNSMTYAPVFIRNARLDIVAENSMFRALYAPAYALPDRPVNLARFTFLHAEIAEEFYGNWDAAADINVGILRTEAGRNPHDKALQDLVGELSTRSAEFRQRWGAHNVRFHANGTKQIHHPVVGDLDLVYDTMAPAGANGLDVTVYSAEPGSTSEESLQLLATWIATQEAPPSRHADALRNERA